MLPPGRRRNALSPASLLLAAILLFTSTAAAASAVLGIDVGTEYMKAVLVKPGKPLEIVLSKDSKRRETAAISFKPVGLARGSKRLDAGVYPERSYGGDALALSARFPGDVYPNLKKLLGLPLDGLMAQTYKKTYPALELVKASKDRDSIGFKSHGFHQDEPAFAVEELLAMQFKNVRENAQLLAGKGHNVRATVLTIPAFFTAEERKSLTLAAELAGLQVFGLVSDGLAVGINYATNRNFPVISEGAKPEYHLVFDVGAGSTKATVLQMNGRSVKDIGKFNKTVEEVSVLGVGWDRTLGGDALNQIIVDDMISAFIASPAAKGLGKASEDVRQNGRATNRLWRDAEKVRQVLSANQETGASFEELHGEVDFRYKLSRTTFEEKTTSFADRLEAPIRQALKAAGITIEELDSVILFGGAVRTPFIQKKVESLVGTAKIRTNVNADEAAVFGAAFKAARLSPSFRVKEIRDSDVAGYATWLRWRAEGKEHSQKLFTPTSLVTAPKIVPFKNVDDFTFNLYQSMGAEDAAAPVNAGASVTVTTTNLTASYKQLIDVHGCKPENITHEWSLRLDPIFGLPDAVEGTVSCEIDLTVPKKDDEGKDKDSIADSVKGMFGFGKKDAGEQEPLKESASSSASAEEGKSTDEAKKDKKEKKVKKSKAPKSRVEVIRIAFESRDGSTGFSQAEIRAMQDRLVAFDNSDKSRRTREEDLNNLESFTYKIRDYLTNEDFLSYLPEAAQSSLSNLNEETSSWLSEESRNAASETLQSKLKALRDVVMPALKRQNEALKRPESIKNLQGAMNSTTSMLTAIKDALAEQAEAATKSAADAAKAATEVVVDAASSVSSAVVGDEEPTTSSDPLADLEEDVSSSSSATATKSAVTETPSSIFTPYTDTDLTDLTTVYEKATAWLADKLEEQDLLPSFQDPIISTSDLEKYTKELNDAVMDLFQRRLKKMAYNKPKASASSKVKKAKKSAKSAASAASSGASSAASAASSGASSAASVVTEAAGDAVKSASSVVSGAASAASGAAESLTSRVVNMEFEVPEDGGAQTFSIRDEL